MNGGTFTSGKPGAARISFFLRTIPHKMRKNASLHFSLLRGNLRAIELYLGGAVYNPGDVLFPHVMPSGSNTA